MANSKASLRSRELFALDAPWVRDDGLSAQPRQRLRKVLSSSLAHAHKVPGKNSRAAP
jgi:hypothetical protein